MFHDAGNDRCYQGASRAAGQDADRERDQSLLARNEAAAGGRIFSIRQSLAGWDPAVSAGEWLFLSRRVVCYVPMK